MSDNTLWYGYLEAGERSSPVLMDSRLLTGLADTIYVYNHKRGEILEYKKAIVQDKLRELKADEKGLAQELRSGYKKARSGFVPRGARTASIPEKGRPAAAKAAPIPVPAEEEGYEEEAFIDEGGGDDEDES